MTPLDQPSGSPRYHRIAIVGANASHRSEAQIASAARRMGATAKVFDVLGDTRRFGSLAAPILARRIAAFDPDFILCTRHAIRLGARRLRTLVRGRRSAFWFFDAVEHRGTVELGQICDVMYTTYANQRELWESRGVPEVRFLPQALDPDTERPASKLRPADICEASFVGSGPYPHRWTLLEAVAGACDLQVRGPGWNIAPPAIPVRGGRVVGARFAEVVGAAAVSLGAHAVPAQEAELASASDRMWKVMGCGGAYVGPWVPGIEMYAQDREHCRWFRSPDECVAIVLDLLGHPDQRRAMAARGHAHAMKEHTYDARLALLFDDREMALPST
ncbi:MAG: glycosyltransferase [Gemmatimonadales bacterium]|nr:glycosyltransferase [Gemmatimonadales bacterium]